MSDHYFRPIQKQPAALVAALLVLMLLALMAVPSLAFADADEAMPTHLISPDDIAAKVSQELQHAGYGDVIEASVQTKASNTMFGADEPMEIEVSGLRATRDSHQWSANILFKNGDKILSALPMKGRFDEMVELPVLSRPLASGQIITEDDLALKSFPMHYQRAGVVNDQAELLGKSVRRNVSDHRPIREHEVSLPIVVKKNDLISIHYNNANLAITTTGQVMADAAIGDVVAIKNLNSDKTIRAVIRDGKTAIVNPRTQTSALAQGGQHAYR